MKFSIRDLLLVTLTAAIGTSWGIDHWRLTTRLEEQAAAWKEDHQKLTEQLEKRTGGLFRKARIKGTNGPPLAPHGVIPSDSIHMTEEAPGKYVGEMPNPSPIPNPPKP